MTIAYHWRALFLPVATVLVVLERPNALLALGSFAALMVGFASGSALGRTLLDRVWDSGMDPPDIVVACAWTSIAAIFSLMRARR